MQICLQFSQPRCQRSQFFFSLLSIFLPIFFANDKRVFLEKKKKKKKKKEKKERVPQMGTERRVFRRWKWRFGAWIAEGYSEHTLSILLPSFLSHYIFFFLFLLLLQESAKNKHKNKNTPNLTYKSDVRFWFLPNINGKKQRLSLCVFCVSVCSVPVSEWECEEGVQNSKFWERAMRENF